MNSLFVRKKLNTINRIHDCEHSIFLLYNCTPNRNHFNSDIWFISPFTFFEFALMSLTGNWQCHLGIKKTMNKTKVTFALPRSFYLRETCLFLEVSDQSYCAKGSFNNYMDMKMSFFDHLPTSPFPKILPSSLC